MACAVVSGAASGIGRACAVALAAEGLAIAALDLTQAEGFELALQADVADAEAVEAGVARAESELGPVEVVVTAAGYYERAAIGETGVEAWRRMLAVQLGGTVNLARSAYARMRDRGAGAICTIGSELALCGDADAAHYAAAKGAIHAFTKSLAVEAAPHGVRVNCVAPGPTDTPLMTPAMRDPAYVGSLVLGRLVAPEEIAATVRFVTRGSHNLVGQVISPNAGAVVSTALVTGAGQGMGAAIAARLARDGHDVAVNDLVAENAHAVAERIGGRAVPFDVADPDAAAAAIAAVGDVDILVANHAHMTMAPFEDTRPDDWARTIDVNLLGTATLLELTAPGMVERGSGRVVVIASEWGVIGWPNATSYAASKGGLIALVKSAARALGPRGVAVNAIAPGITDTPQLQVDADDAGLPLAAMIERYARDVPLGRVGSTDDIAEVVAFLCGDAAIALVGQVIQPNGGTTR